eukprot:COSAG06_NODE_17620_length_930_cov_1.125150_2_plen_104_part_00
MPLGGRKNKGKKPAPMMQLGTAEDAFEQSYAVRGGARGEAVVLGMGAGSKSKGDEVTINSHHVSRRHEAAERARPRGVLPGCRQLSRARSGRNGGAHADPSHR